MWVWLVGQNGESSHTAQRATAHHSLPGLAIQGHLPPERNGEPTTASSLNSARQSGLQAGTKAGAARTGCVSGAREGGAAASGLDSPEQGESILCNYVIFNVAKQEGSPILKRSGKIGEPG